MEAGRIVGSDTAEALKSDAAVQHAFLGGTPA
jgi:branched-chain amino acid transport system ATP-binding protein